jgi:hypothetical protein
MCTSPLLANSLIGAARIACVDLTISADFPVKTCGHPRIQNIMENITVRPGDKAVFNCKVSLGDKAVFNCKVRAVDKGVLNCKVSPRD